MDENFLKNGTMNNVNLEFHWKLLRTDIRISEPDTWHQLKDYKRIGSKIFKMLDAYGQILNLRFFLSNRLRAFANRIVPCFSFRFGVWDIFLTFQQNSYVERANLMYSTDYSPSNIQTHIQMYCIQEEGALVLARWCIIKVMKPMKYSEGYWMKVKFENGVTKSHTKH